MYCKNYQITGPLPTLEEMEASYKKTGKCPTEIKLGKKGITATVLGKAKEDYLYITKNGYHGVGITVAQEQGQYFVMAGECIPSKVVAWLRGQAGLLLLPLFPLIWGKQKAFYAEIEEFIKNTYHVESTLDVNDLNMMNMFKKKQTNDQ